MQNKSLNDFADFDYKSFTDLLFSLTPLQFSILGSILGIFISIPLNPQQQNTLGNFFQLVGQVISTYQAQNVYNAQGVSLEQFQNFKNETNHKLNEIIDFLRNK